MNHNESSKAMVAKTDEYRVLVKSPLAMHANVGGIAALAVFRNDSPLGLRSLERDRCNHEDGLDGDLGAIS